MFFSRNKGPKVRDVMYMDESACAAAADKWLTDHPGGKAGVWFPHDMEQWRKQVSSNVADRVILAQRLAFGHSQGSDVLFIGHYPLRAVETALYEELGLKEILVYAHFDMPFMKLFGSAKIKELMSRMGMQPGEAIEHSMISASIKNALDKIASKVTVDMPARSEAEWMQNLGN